MKNKMLFSGGPFDDSMWNHYRVTWQFVGKLCGSTPFNESVMEDWQNSMKPSVKPAGGKTITEIAEEVINRLPDMGSVALAAENKSTIVFQQVDGKLIAPAYTVRAHIKDCTSQVQNQLVGKIKGERNFTTRVKNGLYVKGDIEDKFKTSCISITRDGKPVEKWDGFLERLVHASTPQGPISAIKKFAYVTQPTMTFVVGLLGDSVKPQDLAKVLMYGATHGYAGERSMGEGRYTFTIEAQEK